MAPFDLKEEILRLKEERNAIILAHSYQTGDIQDMADYVGDSLGLAYKAQNTDCDVIAFCGVHFMAETAKILNPDKTVILPDADAGCSLEASCDAGELEAFLKENAHKNYYVVAYVNCSIGVKALADVIVTSGNAVKIVSQAPEDRPILFVPDQNLGAWVSRQLGRPLELWNGAYAVVAGVIVGLIALCALPVVQRLARWLLHFLPDTGRWAERRESWLEQLDTLSTESRHLLVDKPRCAAILGVHLVKLFLLFCLPWMGLRFMGLDTGLAFWQVQLLTSLTLFVSNALPNVAGMGSVETAFLLVYSSFLPDASSMSLLMFYRLASYYAVFAASAVGFGLAQRRLSRE